MQKFVQFIALMPPAKIFTVGLSFSLVTGLYACGKGVNSGINLKNFNIGTNVAQIQKITKKNQDTTIYIQGKVEKYAPLIKKKAYQINDSTGKIWVITNQGNFQVGEQVVLKGNVQYQSVPLAGKEYGEVYLEEK
ncbi:hypothetical protein IQ226_23720 [Dolichospermum sp. LEGE 00240]|jgi:hypothetical protein|uniref:hypothetical protein n=1 Tax=Dolichospermum sp. LEGE 00240 TaxID=1828603 RepID=UPI00187E2197|nr:hypothetical protein [Dolichospermum sp. LEGE 00240]MBE9252048.1 hypothetical protein [Dolichospermum sp. LEGE 00240]MDM3847485.1 hypothetical protein [Aphanizomenon gracile PMC638.10]MDM3853469.1 hypothetical protein [Aphanizomenon gracile PMC649.10]